ncbi:hypothetical protein [Deinococcus radiophilus]|nr:hypothetical protein [Deinococcus radiophilus]
MRSLAALLLFTSSALAGGGQPPPTALTPRLPALQALQSVTGL